MSFDPGVRVGPYEVIAAVGAGGMGEVYRARDLRLDRDVALKVIRDDLVEKGVALSRFRAEAKSIAALSHPNIVSIYDVGEQGPSSYIVMEFLEGETLRQAMVRPLSWRRTAKIGATIADALQCAHARDIVHRDLKPENVVVTAAGIIKVLDFGLARLISGDLNPDNRTLTSPGTVMGTPSYMSPEQVRGESIGPATDIFSLGCMLYEMLAGKTPFARASGAETMAAILRDEPPDLRSIHPDIPDGIIRIVEHCLEKDPRNRFQSAADVAFALSAADSFREETTTPVMSPQAPRRRRSLVGLGMLLLALITVIVVGRDRAARDATAATPGTSVAVLRFVNAATDSSLDYLSDGLTEALINDLSPVAGFKVLSRNSMFAYKPDLADPRRIGRELGVDRIVSGRVAQRNGYLLVSVELTDARDGRQIWGERYERPLSAITDLEQELARQISERLKMRLSGEDESRIARRVDVNPEAYRLYLLGRYEWSKRTPAELIKGIEYFRQSIEVDPDYAPAHLGIADTYLLLGGNYEILPPREAMPLARQAAERALSLDPTLAEAHATLGVLAHEYDWNWRRSEESFRRAIELNPNSVVAHQWFGQALLHRSRFDEGMRHLRRAEELDPLSFVTKAGLAQAFWLTENYSAAFEEASELIGIEPRFWLGHWYLGLALIGLNDLERALTAFERAVELGGSPSAIGTLGYVYARTGRRDDALRLLARLRDNSKARFTSPAAFLIIHLGLGDLDSAFQAVERGIEERTSLITVLHVAPLAEPLRNDPRYPSYARRTGLPPLP
jgi:eukaryotic-like serine/threonine-protein kinase